MKKVWALAAGTAFVVAAQGAHASAFTNGSFELPGASNPYDTLSAGSNAITGWTIGGAGVDYIGNNWVASNGLDSIDLNALDAGSISQSFDTIGGQQYTVKFDYSGNPGGPATKTFDVSAGSGLKSFQFDSTGTDVNHMNWTQGVFTFVALASSTTLEFLSTMGGSGGAALDNVSVAATPIPPAALMFLTALLALGGFGYHRRAMKIG